MPDHESLFGLLATNLEKSQPPVFVSVLFSEHFTSVKNVVICMVSQLINTNDDESDVRQYLLHFNVIYRIIIYRIHWVLG